MNSPAPNNTISIPVASSADLYLGRSRMFSNIEFNGSPGGAWSAIADAAFKRAFYVMNNTDQTVTVKRPGQPGIAITAGNAAFLQFNGTDVVYAAAPPIEDLGAAIYDVNTLRIASAVQDGETITINTDVYEFDTTVTPGITAGHIRIDVSGGSTAAATQTVASTDNTTNVANGDTVVVNGKTYTFQTVLTNVDGHVFIGADIDTSLTNLANAINLGTGSGTLYAALTTAGVATSSAVASHVLTLTAKIPGTVGNAYTLSTNDAGNDAITLGAGTFASGVDPTAAEASAAFILAVASSLYAATRVSDNETLITVTSGTGHVAYACTETMAGSNNAFAAATTYGGAAAAGANVVIQKRVPLTQEVNLGNMHFAFPFTPIDVTVQVTVTSTGATIAWDGKVTIVAGAVTVDNSGSTDWATTNTVSVLAMG